jgi:citrate synthase
LRRGDTLPGFGHLLYPDGDPRGAFLTEAALAAAPDSSAASVVRTARDSVQAQVGLAPSLDFGLVAAGRVLGLPAGAPLLIFALGRIAGWVGHIIEQYQANHLIRPRARYTGPQPRASTP